MCVAEFMRILLDKEHMDWDEAWQQTVKTMSYTNHTIMAEALEKWPVEMLAKVQPRILQIIQEIDRRYALELEGKKIMTSSNGHGSSKTAWSRWLI